MPIIAVITPSAPRSLSSSTIERTNNEPAKSAMALPSLKSTSALRSACTLANVFVNSVLIVVRIGVNPPAVFIVLKSCENVFEIVDNMLAPFIIILPAAREDIMLRNALIAFMFPLPNASENPLSTPPIRAENNSPNELSTGLKLSNVSAMSEKTAFIKSPTLFKDLSLSLTLSIKFVIPEKSLSSMWFFLNSFRPFTRSSKAFLIILTET